MSQHKRPMETGTASDPRERKYDVFIATLSCGTWTQYSLQEAANAVVGAERAASLSVVEARVLAEAELMTGVRI